MQTACKSTYTQRHLKALSTGGAELLTMCGIGFMKFKESANSCQKQLMLGDLGACPPRKILNFSSSEIAFWAILG